MDYVDNNHTLLPTLPQSKTIDVNVERLDDYTSSGFSPSRAFGRHTSR